ncbi:hypothetical protein R1sor_005158 [Riccia sorocarpa]|uniref:Uncharacterized protein n=1 Tax=Riccia sorocarpa TaxID=122646 RepID=A0ABD3HLR1_9MARC
MTKQRSVIQTLDLPDDYGDYDHFTPESCGWLSPRNSFSGEYAPSHSRGSQTEMEIMSPEGSCCSTSSRLSKDDGSLTSVEFEFAMASSGFHDALSEGFYMTADELFHGGKLLPGYITPDGKKEVLVVEPALISDSAEGRTRTPVTIARHLSAESLTESSSTPSPPPMGCAIGSGCARTPKPPKWRELFGALRRVKSDSGRQRVPEETFLPPKAMQGGKNFFKHFFSHGQNNATAPQEGVKMSTATIFSPVPPPRSYAPSTAPSSVSFNHPVTSTFPPIPPSSADLSSCSRSFSSFDVNEVHNTVNLPQVSAEVAVETSCSRGTGSSESFLAEAAAYGRSKGIASSAATTSSSKSSAGGKFSSLGIPARKVERPVAGANLMRSASGRVIVRGLDRAGSGNGNNINNSSVKNSAALQEQLRALRSREIRRSPERSVYASNVRVTPVLNVPGVCMGPVLRGATKAGKGKLSNFRSFLSFKREKPPTSLSAPIATHAEAAVYPFDHHYCFTAEQNLRHTKNAAGPDLKKFLRNISIVANEREQPMAEIDRMAVETHRLQQGKGHFMFMLDIRLPPCHCVTRGVLQRKKQAGRQDKIHGC